MWECMQSNVKIVGEDMEVSRYADQDDVNVVKFFIDKRNEYTS